MRLRADAAVFIVAYLFLLERGAAHAVPATHGLSLLAGMLCINTVSGLYRPSGGRSIHQWCARAAVAMVLALALSYMIFDPLPPEFADGKSIRWLTMFCVAGVVAHRIYAAHGDASSRPYSRVLILGSGATAQTVACDGGRETADQDRRLRSGAERIAKHRRFQPVARRHDLAQRSGGSPERRRNRRRSDRAPRRQHAAGRVARLQERWRAASDTSTYFERMLGQIRIDQLHPGWLTFGKGFDHSTHRDIAKWLFDTLLSCVLLVLAAPLMIITAVCIAVDSKGPIFYRQERVGQNGKTFSVLKFRSMRVDAENSGAPQWAAAKDDRVTRVGATLRRFRLDELPQLLNVLRGEMSLVGPRPERPFFVNQLTKDIPFYALRHSVKPGVTGWAQVRYHYGASIEDSLEKLQYDLYYVKNHSLRLDLLVLFATVGVVLSGKGAR